MVRENEIVQTIVAYIDRNLKKGYNLEELKWALISQKYSRIEIDKAIKIVQARTPQPREEPTRTVIAPIVEEVVPEKKSFWKKLFGWI